MVTPNEKKDMNMLIGYAIQAGVLVGTIELVKYSGLIQSIFGTNQQSSMVAEYAVLLVGLYVADQVDSTILGMF